MRFSFTNPPTAQIYTLSLHDALPILIPGPTAGVLAFHQPPHSVRMLKIIDRKSTRLNSSHTVISYAVFCLKKKNCTLTDLSCQTDATIVASARPASAV